VRFINFIFIFTRRSSPSLTGDYSKIRPAYRVWDVFQVLLGRIATIAIGYFRVQSSYKKNLLKTFKPFKICRILAGRPLRNPVTAPRSSRHQSRNRPIFFARSRSSLVLKPLTVLSLPSQNHYPAYSTWTPLDERRNTF